MLIEQHNTVVFAARSFNRSIIYLVFVALDCAMFTAHLCLGVCTLPFPLYYTTSVFSPGGAERHLIYVLALKELAARAVMRFLLATQDGALSILGMSSNMKPKISVLFSASVEGRQIVEQVNFLLII